MAGFGLPDLRLRDEDELKELRDAIAAGEVDAPAAEPEATEPPPTPFSSPPPQSSRPTPLGAEALGRAHDRDNSASIGQEAINNITNAFAGKTVQGKDRSTLYAGQRGEMRQQHEDDARAATIAEASDPRSGTSQATRSMLKEAMPDLVGQMGPMFERLSHAKAKELFPFLNVYMSSSAKKAATKDAADKEAQRLKERKEDAGVKATERQQDLEIKLRQQFEARPEFKKMQDVSAAVDKIRRAGKSQDAVSDMAMVYALITTLDPGSAVKEGEYASAKNTTGVPGLVMNLFNQAKNGRFLNDQQRAQLTAVAEELVKTHRAQVEPIAAQMRTTATEYGLNPKRVVFDYDGTTSGPGPTAASPGDQSGGGDGRPRREFDGEVRVWNGEEWVKE